jgi:hypothetical protein
MADEDYIAARMAYRTGLSYASLWAGQQAIEKYLKCILLLNRIHAPNVRHSLDEALKRIEDSGKVSLNLKQVSLDFINYLDEIGAFRYFEVSTVVSGRDFVKLDRVVWELRRFCTLDSQLQSSNYRWELLLLDMRSQAGYLKKSPIRKLIQLTRRFSGIMDSSESESGGWSNFPVG